MVSKFPQYEDFRGLTSNTGVFFLNIWSLKFPSESGEPCYTCHVVASTFVSARSSPVHIAGCDTARVLKLAVQASVTSHLAAS